MPTLSDYRFAFIVGCGHTGTTLLTVILGDHSKVFAIPVETSAFRKRAPAPPERVLEAALEEGGVGTTLFPEVIVEKTPRHVHELDKIKQMFPDAILIATTRDPRDIVASLKERGVSLDQAILRCVRAHKDILAAKEKYPVHVIRYEDFVTNSEAEVKALCEVIGVTFEPDMLLYHTRENRFNSKNGPVGQDAAASDGDGVEQEGPTPTKHTAYRNWQINQPIMDRRGRYHSILTPEEVATVERETEFMMKPFGYAVGDAAPMSGTVT